MNRRTFARLLAGLPFLGLLWPRTHPLAGVEFIDDRLATVLAGGEDPMEEILEMTEYTGTRSPYTFITNRETRTVKLEVRVDQLASKDDPDILVNGISVPARAGEIFYMNKMLDRHVLYARGDVETMAEAWERIPHP